ncbi:MAG: DUF2252 domain-containing protein [Candidatus Acidiferrales bacterium]
MQRESRQEIESKSHHKPEPHGRTVEERVAEGRSLRKRTPRSSHATWKASLRRPDPVSLLIKTDQGLLADLLPIRYGRMRQSPFAFYRGAGALMAFDISKTPATGLRVQGCGDCHVANFGGFGSPERTLVFDINDFDETLPAPWEWDVKRLAASIVLAGRVRDMREHDCDDAARIAVESYRNHMREYARMPAIDVWYSHLEASILIDDSRGSAARKRWIDVEEEAKSQTATHALPRITEVSKGRRRIIDRPPLVYHSRQLAKVEKTIRDIFRRYRETLPEERRVILDRYHIVDIARKVVGIGSVGTRCAVALLMAGENDPLFLQFKEARASILEPYAGRSCYENHGQRVVTGQRMLQAASDVFLGWTRDDNGRDYYFRQLRDMKMTVDFSTLSKQEWKEYVSVCGWTLARAHARTGDSAKIAGYLGKNEAFDEAIRKFAVAYADQTERDYAALVKAIRTGRLRAKEA